MLGRLRNSYFNKVYSVEMLLSRLSIGEMASILAGVLATRVARDHRKTALLVGIAIFMIAGYVHFFRVWADYPLWYHFTYLLPIIPVTWLSHLLVALKMKKQIPDKF